MQRKRKRTYAPKRLQYIRRNLDGEWRFSPRCRMWICTDGRYITRTVGAYQKAFYTLYSKHHVFMSEVTDLVNPPVTLAERREIMRRRDQEILMLHRQGYSCSEIGNKFPRLGPHSERGTLVHPIGKERVRRIIKRALVREQQGV